MNATAVPFTWIGLSWPDDPDHSDQCFPQYFFEYFSHPPGRELAIRLLEDFRFAVIASCLQIKNTNFIALNELWKSFVVYKFND